EDYCRRTASGLIELAARLLDPQASEASLEFAGPVGISVATAGLLRAFPSHAARGQLFIPGEVLARHQVDVGEILAGRPGPGLDAALAAMRERAAFRYEAARSFVAQAPAAVIPAWLPAALVPQYLRALRRGEPFRAVDVPQWRRQWALWRE